MYINKKRVVMANFGAKHFHPYIKEMSQLHLRYILMPYL